MELPYTICFCVYQERVLMLRRALPPNAQLWNGMGGKIEEGETPLASVRREMQEEAGLDLKYASSLFFAGIVSWGLRGHDPLKGMYIFLAHLSRSQAEQTCTVEMSEGLVEWQPLTWVCDPHNRTVVSNIPHFLPPILDAQQPYEYFCEYESKSFTAEAFQRLLVRPLPAHIALGECQE